jgi:exopolysaccharide biosynthesis polyprenyl glycosylphosphotransferase
LSEVLQFPQSAAAFALLRSHRVDLDALDDEWILQAGALRCGGVEQAIRRGLDILLSLLLLALAMPLLVVTALAVRLESPGPVIYRQVRAGLHARPFTLLKFRSMRSDAEAGVPVWAARNDPRVTAVGRVIRMLRIDELPQLVNVLRGEMSLIGPRPERPVFVEQLARAIPFYADRCRIKPGITGWAQVNLPYGASIEDARQKLAYDLYYLRHRSVALDVITLLATVRVVLLRQGAR